MSKKSLKMRAVKIEKAPGFRDGGFAVDNLCDGVNIIYGPNASGKTTFSRAIFTLLWPEDNERTMNLLADFVLAGEPWRAEVEGTRYSYTREGEPVTEPLIPAVEMSDRYLLSLHEMLQADTRGRGFAEAVQRETAGGYDLRKAMDELGFKKDARKASIKETKNVKVSLEKLKHAEKKVEEVQEEKAELPSFCKKLEIARSAAQRLEYLNKAIDFLEARAELDAVRAKLDAYPDVMKRVEGDEYQKLQASNSEMLKQREKKKNALGMLEKARNRQKQTRLSGDGATVETLSRLDKLLEQLQEADRELKDNKQQCAERKKKRDEIHSRLDVTPQEEELRGISVKKWQGFHDFAQRYLKCVAEREALERLKSVLEPDDNDDRQTQDLISGAEILVDWLNARPDTVAPKRPICRSLVIIAAAALLTMTAGLLTSGAGFIGIVVLVASVAGALLHRMMKNMLSHESRIRQERQRRFTRLDLEPPASWEREDVCDRVLELYQQYCVEQERKVRSDAWKGNQQKLDDVRAAIEDLEDQRRQMAAAFGMAPGDDPVSLVRFSEKVSQWQEEDGELKRLQAGGEVVECERNALLANIAGVLNPFGYDAPADYPDALGNVDGLKQRQRLFEDSSREMEEKKKIVADADAAIGHLQEERSEIFSRLNLQDDDETGAKRLCDLFDNYQELKDEERVKAALSGSAEQKANDAEDMIPGYKELPPGELKSEADELNQRANEKEGLQQKISEINTRINEAGKNATLELAMAEKERALDELNARYDDDCRKVVGFHLGEYLRNSGGRAGRPEVFKRAEDLLVAITRGRYKLSLGEGGTVDFRAYDTVKDGWFALDELSSATRVQLLLAVRMAFVETQESAIQLPLVFDETLANTDDARSGAVIGAAIELAKRGRQIFYLTAQSDEVGRWKTALDRVADIEYRVKELEFESNRAKDIDWKHIEPFTDDLEPPTAPEGCDHQSYGEMVGVPVLNPRLGAGAAHIWYIVHSPELICRLLRLQVERWGQLRAMIESGQEQLISEDTGRIREISQNGAALEAFVRAWMIGRGDLVDRQVLEESGAVSDIFLDRVASLAEEVDGDGEALIKQLSRGAVSGFLSKKADELAAYLESEGYTENIPPLDPDEVRRRVIHAFVEAGVGHDEAVERADGLLAAAAGPREGGT